jgi:hypothetical protein
MSVPIAVGRGWLVAPAVLVLCVLIASSVTPVRPVGGGEPPELREATRILWRTDGSGFSATVLAETSVIDPNDALDELLPGTSRGHPGGAAAQFAIIRPWARLPVHVSYNPKDVPVGIDGEFATRFAVGTWSVVSGSRFRFVFDGLTDAGESLCDAGRATDGLNAVSWRTNLRDGVLGIMCAEFQRLPDGKTVFQEGDVVFTTKVKWSSASPTPDDSYDLLSTAVHELGHLAGLDHTEEVSSVMTPTLGRGKQTRLLQQDDLNGMIALYGTGERPVSPPQRPLLSQRVVVADVAR